MKNKAADVTYCGVRKEMIAKARPKLHPENIKHLEHWINERYNIRLLKDVEKKPKPWTKDPVLLKYRFCNVRREHDRESRWLIANIALNNKLSYDNKLLNCVLFRFFNKYDTVQIFGPLDFRNISYNNIQKKLDEHKKNNPSYVYFSNAFYMSGPKGAANKKFGRSDIRINIIKLVDSYNKDGIIPRIRQCTTQQQIFDTLQSYDGIGQFLAYQIFVDFTYIQEFPFSENEFTIAGPGCKKGLELIFQDFDGLTYEEALFWLRDNQNKWFTPSPKFFSDLTDRTLNVMSLENCMCEISKYLRALKGEGRPRIRYPGI